MATDGTKPMRTRSDRPGRIERGFEEAKTTQPEHGGSTVPKPEAAPELPKPKRKPDAEHPVARGDVISERYRIEGEIGRGGMGAVYRATQLSTNKPVAIKWLFQKGSRFEERKKRFFREARAAAMVRHPNVADVYDFGEHEGGLYMVMECLEGESLRTRLRRGSLGEAEAISLLMPALRGLSAAHAQSVIHRDLKPENVFLCDRAPGVLPEAVLLDFGLSKLADPLLGQSVLTLAGALIGTPQYMAPEQADGKNVVDARCDLYAMAVILYEAISGRRPFLAYSTENLLTQLVHDDPTPLRACAPQVSEAFERAIMRALSRDPALRQPDVETFAREIEGLGQVPFAQGPRVSSFRPERLAAAGPADDAELVVPKRGLAKHWPWAALAFVLAGAVSAYVLSRPAEPRSASKPVVVRVPEAQPQGAAPAPSNEIVPAQVTPPASAQPAASASGSPAPASRTPTPTSAARRKHAASKLAATPIEPAEPAARVEPPAPPSARHLLPLPPPAAPEPTVPALAPARGGDPEPVAPIPQPGLRPDEF